MQPAKTFGIILVVLCNIVNLPFSPRVQNCTNFTFHVLKTFVFFHIMTTFEIPCSARI